MPQLNFTTSVAAGGTYAPLTGWSYEFLPFAAHVRVLYNASAVGTFGAVFSGTEAIVDDSPVTAGGTAGVLPAELNTLPVDFNAPAGDKLRLAFRNPTGGAVTINGIILVNPVG